MLVYFEEKPTLFDTHSGNFQYLCVCCPSANVFSISDYRNFSSLAFKFPSLGLHNSVWVEVAPCNSDSFCYFQHHIFCSTTQFPCHFTVVVSFWILITIDLKLVSELQFTVCVLWMLLHCSCPFSTICTEYRVLIL